MLDQGNSRQTTEDGHQGVDHKPLMLANGLDGQGGESRRGEFVRRIEVRIKQRRSRIVVHVVTVSPLAPVAAHTTVAATRGLPLYSRITVTQTAGDSPRKPAQARLTGLFECRDNQSPLDFTAYLRRLLRPLSGRRLGRP